MWKTYPQVIPVPTLDETDRMIISVTKTRGPMRFTDIFQSLQGLVNASPPKVSRRLKNVCTGALLSFSCGGFVWVWG